MAAKSMYSPGVLWVGVFCLFFLVYPASASWSNPFEVFFPYYDGGLRDILRDNCSDTYALWQENRYNKTNIDSTLRKFQGDSMTSAVVECILINSPALVLTKINEASIVLGLAPTIIAILGLRPHDTAVLSVVGRRYILALTLAIGSPALNAYRMSEFNSVINELREKPHKHPRAIRRFQPIITIFFYILAAASTANVAELTYRIGSRAIFTIGVDAPYLALVWAFIGILIHLLAAFALRLRISSQKISTAGRQKASSWPVELAKDQADVILRQSRRSFVVYPERFFFSVLSLAITILTACHIIFGTLVLSSVIFVALNDSLIIVGRLMASAVTCRIIAMFELAALRDSVEEEDRDNTLGTMMSLNREAGGVDEFSTQPQKTQERSAYQN